MKSLFTQQIELAQARANIQEQAQYIMAITRSILQYAAVGICEQFDTIKVHDLDPNEVTNILYLFRNLHDSSTTDILNRLIPRVRSLGHAGYCRGWYEAHPDHLGTDTRPLSLQLQDWVAFRNKTAHTIPDHDALSAELPNLYLSARNCLLVLDDALPRNTNTDDLVHNIGTVSFPSSTLRLIDNQPVVIRRFRLKRQSWHLEYRTLNILRSQAGVYDISSSPIVTHTQPAAHTFATLRIPCEATTGEIRTWITDAFLPSPQTLTFHGREFQKGELLDWYNDEISTTCLIYGDGGIGKTTLVLEFLHSLLEAPPAGSITWFPEVICFYTAKQTSWSADGLKSIGGSAVLADALRKLVSVVESQLGQDWYHITDTGLVDKVAGVWRDAGIEPRDVLLVIDNAETLERKPSDEQAFHTLLRKISRKVARVVITSRRLEKVEAWQVEVPGLDSEDSIELLKDIAREYSVTPLLQANNATLRNLAARVSHKPLLLEAVAKYLLYPGVSIEAAIDKMQAAVRADLGEFLYDDAWNRMEDAHRDIFLVLSEVRVPITNHVVGWACKAQDTPHLSWLDAFVETHFGKQTEYATQYEIVFVPEALTYFQSKLKQKNEREQRTLRSRAAQLGKQYRQLEEGASIDVSDRIMAAFVSGAAKTAKLHAQRGEYDEADEWYQEATKIEPTNSALFDRYALFLLRYKSDVESAREKVRIAVQLDPGNEEALFTAGMVEYQDGSVESGDNYMDRAQRHGKPEHLCLIQKATGRIRAVRWEALRTRKEELARQALHMFASATDLLPQDPYYYKNKKECEDGKERAEDILGA